MWVIEQCTDALFTEDQSKVAATVHVQCMNSSRLWWKTRAKKKKEGKTQKHNAAKRNTIQTLPWTNIYTALEFKTHSLKNLLFGARFLG